MEELKDFVPALPVNKKEYRLTEKELINQVLNNEEEIDALIREKEEHEYR